MMIAKPGYAAWRMEIGSNLRAEVIRFWDAIETPATKRVLFEIGCHPISMGGILPEVLWAAFERTIYTGPQLLSNAGKIHQQIDSKLFEWVGFYQSGGPYMLADDTAAIYRELAERDGINLLDPMEVLG